MTGLQSLMKEVRDGSRVVFHSPKSVSRVVSVKFSQRTFIFSRSQSLREYLKRNVRDRIGYIA